MTMNKNVERYITLKQGLGYKFSDQAQILRKYAAYANAFGDNRTLTNRIIEWARRASSPHRSREWFNVARHFAIAMHAEDSRNEIPPRDAFGRGKRQRPTPNIIAEADIYRIMNVALSLPPIASITPHTYHYLFGLIATTGLRISEALSLKIDDITPDGLMIRETKFRKTRLVPIHESVRGALNKYMKLRNLIGGPNPHLFVISTGAPPDSATVTRTFSKLTRRTGVRGLQKNRGPRVHDLRHSFAVRSLEQCGGDRMAVDRHMLALSTYLGHACTSDTYWYLEATPVLRQQIAESTEAFRNGGKP